MMRHLRGVVGAVGAAVVAAVVVVAACAGSPSTVELTVFGAASLRGALEAVEEAYEAATPGVTITLSTDSSAALATQIAEGAPADVFLSADTQRPTQLIDGGFVSGEARVFATNELAVIVPTAHPSPVERPHDLAASGVRIVAAGPGVPITTYATELVEGLARLEGYSADFAARYAANIVSREDNVSSVVTKVGLGEGDAGIVYATDAKASTAVRALDLPAEANVRADYAGVVVASSPAPDEAHAFLDWLTRAEARAILGTFGFLPPR